MTTDPEKTIVPPSQTRGGNAPDADEVARNRDSALRAAQGVDPSIRGTAMNAMQAVRDYAVTKRA